MPKYSRSHERAERAKIARGMWESLFGLIFAWLPGVGLILSVTGFCRQAVRMTEAHKARRFLAMLFASVVLIASIGALMGEAYLYSRNPAFAADAGRWVWQKVTGQDALPGEAPATDTQEEGDVSADETVPDETVPDEYHTGDAAEEGDVQTEEGDVPADGQMEEGDVPAAEGDFQDNIDFNEDDTDESTGGDAAGSADATIPPLSDLLKSNGVAVG